MTPTSDDAVARAILQAIRDTHITREEAKKIADILKDAAMGLKADADLFEANPEKKRRGLENAQLLEGISKQIETGLKQREAVDANGLPPGYRKPHVRLTGTDGNAFALMARVASAMRQAGASEETVRAFFDEAKSGDYDNLLRVLMKYADVD